MADFGELHKNMNCAFPLILECGDIYRSSNVIINWLMKRFC